MSLLEVVRSGRMWRRCRSKETCGERGGMDGMTAREAASEGSSTVSCYLRAKRMCTYR